MGFNEIGEEICLPYIIILSIVLMVIFAWVHFSSPKQENEEKSELIIFVLLELMLLCFLIVAIIGMVS